MTGCMGMMKIAGLMIAMAIGGMLAQEVYARHPDRVAALILSGTTAAFGSRDGSFQEAFLKALANLGRFAAGTNFRAWLFRIAHNAFANQHRASRPRAPLPDDLAADEQGPAEQALCREALEKLAEAVQQLPAEFRAALLLRVEEELSFRQIADVMGITEPTAR